MPRGGLSPDPDKAKRQLEALADGRKALAKRLAGSTPDSQGSRPAKPRQPAKAKAKKPDSQGKRVHRYEDDDGKAKAKPARPRKPREERDGGDDERRPGFLDGLLGRV